MKQSGLADSPFFTVPAKPAPAGPSMQTSAPAPLQAAEPKASQEKQVVGRQQGNQDTMQSSKHASMHVTMDESIIDFIRSAVKAVGKESATYRLTPEEKKALLELTFTYKVQGFKTSENELTRIAVNFILEDHKQNGRNSILEKVLQALNK